jgi:hypothetical protein
MDVMRFFFDWESHIASKACRDARLLLRSSASAMSMRPTTVSVWLMQVRSAVDVAIDIAAR